MSAHRAAIASRPVAARRTVAPASHLPALDSLRGVAILLVYLFHLDLAVMARYFSPAGTSAGPAAAFVRAGHTGVSLFFVLSGFLVGGQFLDEIAGGAPVDRRRYAARRALRILPLYWVTVTVATLATATHVRELARGLPYLVFLNAFQRFAVPLGSFSGVWWTLATEAQFYAVMPLVAALLRPGRRSLGGALLFAYALAYGAFLAGRLGPSGIPSQVLLAHSLFGEAPLFIFGAVAARVHRSAGGRIRRRRSWHDGVADVVVVLVVCLLGVVLRWTVALGPIYDAPPYQAWRLLEGLLWTIVVLLLLLAPLRLEPLLSNRALAAVGLISYSIDLVHVPFVSIGLRAARATFLGPLIGWSPLSALVVAALTVGCFAVAFATHRVIERPFLVRKARLGAVRADAACPSRT